VICIALATGAFHHATRVSFMSHKSEERIERLFYPKGIAIVGASERARYAVSLIQNLLRFGFSREKIFPVNPRYEKVFGLPCYPRVSEIPTGVDLVVVAIPRDGIVDVLEESAAKGIAAALILSAGFAEYDEKGQRLQEEIGQLADRYSICVCGPNTLGIFFSHAGLAVWSTPLDERLRSGPVAAISNSSGILYSLLNMAAERCIGIRYGIAPGNEANLDLVDFFDWLLNDDEVRVVLALIESVKRPKEFRDLLDLAREKEKWVVALRLGRSDKGSRAVASHTGNLATSGKAWEALFRQKGVISVDNLEQMVEAAALLVMAPTLPSQASPGGIGFVTNSGGDCSYISDICDRLQLSLPDLSDKTHQAITGFFGEKKRKGNPFDVEDLHAVDEGKFYSCLKRFMAEEAFSLVCCRLNFPRIPDEWIKRVYSQVAAIAKDAGKKIVFLSRASEPLDPEWFEFFSQLKVPLLLEYERGLRAVGGFLRAAYRVRLLSSRSTDQKVFRPHDLQRLRSTIFVKKFDGLSYRDVREILLAYEVPLIDEILVKSASEAVAAARALGFPVALKIVSPNIPHKTELGGVLLDLKEEREVEGGFYQLELRTKENAPDAVIEGILVQKMAPGGIELIVGTSYDSQLGLVAVFGVGGIYAEIIRDVSLRVLPISSSDAWDMIGEIKGRELLHGARGRPKADLHAVVDSLLRVSQLALDFRDELESVELNPLVCFPEGEGVAAVDVLMRPRR